jgi:predicted transport protein
LTQADLIRNFILMRQDEQMQTKLYHDYWQPIEQAFGPRYRSDFDKFVRDYLTLQLEPSKQIRADQIYQHFRTYFYRVNENNSIDNILENLNRFGNYYVAFSLGQEKNKKLREAFYRLRSLIEVAAPVVLKLYDCYSRAQTLQINEFREAIEILESYVFRRSVCGMQTRNLGQIFATLAYRIKESDPLMSLKVALYRQGKKRRFPTDVEFREALETRDIYDMRNCFYLLDRLENDSKEKIDTSDFSVEHVLPQNKELNAAWKAMLGPDWKSIQETWLHRLGNITLTGYNSKYSDKSFSDKKTIKDGFDDSPLRLNKFIREQEVWTAKQIEKRGKNLATKAIGIWQALSVDIEAVQEAELEERKAQAANYSLDMLEFTKESKALFEKLRPQILELGEDVIELCGPKSITYRVYDFFLEIIPRKRRLTLVLNLDYEECDDPTDSAVDATAYAFIIYASESGGVLFPVRELSQVGAAMHIIRQAYEKVSE